MIIYTNLSQLVCRGGFIYNFKIINYPNGSTQIRVYEELMLASGPAKIKMEVEPFNGTKVRNMGTIGEKEPGESLQNSVARTRRKISEYARCCYWEWFCTFTYAPDRTDRTDFKLCSKRIRQWCNNMRKRYAPDLKYLVIPEMHTKNQDKYGICWHYHLLIAEPGNIEMEFSGHYDKSGRKIYNLPGWRFGFSTAVHIEQGETYRVSRYILKYITKQSHLLSKGCHRYYVSKNLPKPEEITYFVNPKDMEQEIQKIVDSLGKEVVYVSEKQGYIDVKYIEIE